MPANAAILMALDDAEHSSRHAFADVAIRIMPMIFADYLLIFAAFYRVTIYAIAYFSLFRHLPARHRDASVLTRGTSPHNNEY